jgi:hypothetical protein
MPASDQAKFFADYAKNPWHLSDTNSHFYLCRRTSVGVWENALLHQITCFPPHEITDPEGEVAVSSNRLWIEPEDWQPHDFAPTHSPQEGVALFKLYLLKTMYRNIPDPYPKLQNLIQLATGRTHNQFLQLLDQI